MTVDDRLRAVLIERARETLESIGRLAALADPSDVDAVVHLRVAGMLPQLEDVGKFDAPTIKQWSKAVLLVAGRWVAKTPLARAMGAQDIRKAPTEAAAQLIGEIVQRVTDPDASARRDRRAHLEAAAMLGSEGAARGLEQLKDE